MLSVPAAAQDVLLVVHPSNQVPAMPRAELSALLLGKVDQWPDGRAVTIVDQASGSEIREAFCRQVHGRSASSVNHSWTLAIVGGRSQAPVQVDSDAAVLAYVRDHPGAIGYVRAGTELSGVRELPTVDRPERLEFVEPKYTRMAERARLYGVVVMRLTVGEDGAVVDVDVVEHLEMGLSEEAARAARSWRYEPTLVDGRPVQVLLEERVRFRY